MQPLKLKEIIWEITNVCDRFGTPNQCEFCGSTSILKKYDSTPKPILNEHIHILKIAEEICEYPPEEINLSGGEPSTLGNDFLLTVTQILKQKMKVKIITNGSLFKLKDKTINQFDAIGLSINTQSDINLLMDNIETIKKFSKKITAITNFGNHNIFNYTDLKQFLQLIGITTWQLQLTMGNKYQLNSTGITYIRDLINKEKEINVIPADNLREYYECTAGQYSCGITADGNIIGCLSERSYKKDLKFEGSLLKESLKEIWENNFKDMRFRNCFKCCRCFIDYPKVVEKEDENTHSLTKAWEIIKKVKTTPIPNNIMLYGVIPSRTIMYGVSPTEESPIVIMYGIYSSEDSLAAKKSDITYTNENKDERKSILQRLKNLKP